MRLSEIYLLKSTDKKVKRVGRGQGSGHGKTSGRGHKGQKARSGRKLRPGFEGGQMPLMRRVPKRGFHNIFKKKWQIVNVEQLNRFRKDSQITPQMLQEQRLIHNLRLPIKILGEGRITKAINIQAHAFSKKAKEKIETAGGKAEAIQTK